MHSLKEAKEWIDGKYNYCISVYEYDDYIRFTNGSAAYYIDIRLTNDGFCLDGERYGEKITATCDREKNALLDTLSAHV